MKRLTMLKTWIFIIFLFAVNIQQQDNKYLLNSIQQDQDKRYKYQHFDGVPTKAGIDRYVNSAENQKNFIKEYKKIINDSIYNDIFFRTETPAKKTGVLAYNTLSLNSDCEIVVYDLEKFRAFEYDTTKYNNYNDEDYFLKATIFHEISHYYFYQTILEMQRIRHIHVNEYYTQGIMTIPNRELMYGSKFIEEGFCEYIIQRFNYCPEFINVRIPVYKSELEDKKLEFEFQYVFASKCLWNYFDKSIALSGGVKEGLMLILNNRPPNYNEILKPGQYFDRLQLNPVVVDTI
jgi:hypothetical protein